MWLSSCSQIIYIRSSHELTMECKKFFSRFAPGKHKSSGTGDAASNVISDDGAEEETNGVEATDCDAVADAEAAPEWQEGTLRTELLVKKYGKRTVVNNVSIDVTQGEIVGLLGPNGAGKTTTFYMTVGLITPNAGQIFLDYNNITSHPIYKRARLGIGYLAQEASVFRKMSVEDNIRAVLEMTGKPKEYQKEKLEGLIEEFHLQKVRKNYGDRLSGGERRRTEIARCLAIDPKFIMLAVCRR